LKYWEIIADNLSKAGWSWAASQPWIWRDGPIWIADAHRGDGKRFVMRADEKLTAFLELEATIRDAERILSILNRHRTISLARAQSF